jgi:hypothetical protein
MEYPGCVPVKAIVIFLESESVDLFLIREFTVEGQVPGRPLKGGKKGGHAYSQAKNDEYGVQNILTKVS